MTAPKRRPVRRDDVRATLTRSLARAAADITVHGKAPLTHRAARRHVRRALTGATA